MHGDVSGVVGVTKIDFFSFLNMFYFDILKYQAWSGGGINKFKDYY